MEITTQEEVKYIIGLFFMSILLIVSTIAATFLFIDLEKDKYKKDTETLKKE